MICPPWLEVAEREARWGIREISGAEHHPRILDYHEATTLSATTDEVPWCASFVAFCLREAGLESTRSAAARSYLGWGHALELGSTWAHGAIVVLRRSGPDEPGPDVLDAPGHVGFLVGAPTPEEILVLGGNQSNGLNVRAYPRARVLGLRWPNGRD